jgi:hypothetical protein
VVNLLTGAAKPGNISEKGQRGIRERLYNADLFAGFLQKCLSSLSISLNPSKAVIGSRGWYFLGDDHNMTLSSHRYGVLPYDEAKALQVLSAFRSWDTWLRAHGVRCYRVMICPDKPSVYPEFLPSWASWIPSSHGNDVRRMPMDLLLGVGSPFVMSPRNDLLEVKNSGSEDLYYKSDTHWNSRGAWIGYRAFFDGMEQVRSGYIRTLSDDQVTVVPDGGRVGDTARMLRLPESSEDQKLVPTLKIDPPVEVDQVDYDSGKTFHSGGNPEIDVPLRPLLIRSKNALNNKRVLWLRDSFGTALSPFMDATFGEVLQSHFVLIDHEELSRLIEKFHPEYVFVTVVERDILLDWFTKSAPTIHKTP